MMKLDKITIPKALTHLLTISLFFSVSMSSHAQANYYVNANTLCTTGCDGTTWAKAFDSLQSALDAAIEGEEIWVAKGRYFPSKDATGSTAPTDNRDKTFSFNKDLKIYGGFPHTGNPSMGDRDWETHKTTLSGDLDVNDTNGLTGAALKDDATRQENVYTVIHTQNISSDFLMNGFWIKGGNASNSAGSEKGSGGGMYNPTDSNPTISHCSFLNNSAIIDGGAIYNYHNTPTIEDCHFTNNTVIDDGGGIANNGSSTVIKDCTFTNNSAGDKAGALFNTLDSDAIVTNCKFLGSSANIGGGVYNYKSKPMVTNCIFSENSASIDGGAIYNNGNTPTITDCTFINNSATDDGGAISNYDSAPSIKSCTFSNNSADDKAGAIFNISGSRAIITDCSFLENSAKNGGALYNNAYFNMIVCVFSNNSSDDYGGGIYNHNGISEITDCSFFGNTTKRGGGLHNTSGSPILKNCIFSKNPATIDGGGIHNIGGAPSIINCSFSSNTARWGGGVYNAYSHPTLTACTFSKNSVSENGGGMFNRDGSTPKIINCSLFKNLARWGGAMFSRSNCSPIITNSTFSENTASINGDGIYSSDNTHTTISNSIIWNNSVEIYNTSTSTTTVNYSIVEGNYDGTGNWDENPLFIDPINDNFRISCLSPAIDMGNNGADLDGSGIATQTITDISTDLEKNKRTANGTVDMGAYEGAVGVLGTFDYCRGRQAILDAGTWTNYQWSNNESSQIIEVSEGIYTVTVTNQQGCTSTATAEVTAIPCLAEAGTLTTNAATICAGGNIEVSSTGEQTGTNYLQYFFLYTQDNLGTTSLQESMMADYGTGKAAATFEGLEAGDYLVCVYNECQNCLPNPSPITTDLDDIYQTGSIQDGCFDIECTTMNVPEAFTHNAEESGAAPITGTGMTLFIAEVCGGTAPYSMDYDFSSGFISVQEYPSENAGCISYQVTYTEGTDWALTIIDAHNCSNKNVVFTSAGLPSTPLPQITNHTTSPETCIGDEDGSITIEVEGGDISCNEFTYTWSGFNGVNETAIGAVTGNILEDISAGMYAVTVTDCAGTTAVQTGINVTRSSGRGRGRGRGGCKTGAELEENPQLFASPNPFSNHTLIEFSLVETSKVWLSVYSVDGRKVATLLQGETMEGEAWQQVDFEANSLQNGIYILELQTETGIRFQEKLMILE